MNAFNDKLIIIIIIIIGKVGENRMGLRMKIILIIQATEKVDS